MEFNNLLLISDYYKRKVFHVQVVESETDFYSVVF